METMNPRRHIRITRTGLVALIVTMGLAGWLGASDYSINWHTIDAGGGVSSGGGFELTGTAGQPDARNHPVPMAGGDYKLTGGFWVIPECPAVQPDYDSDCDVDQADYTIFEACASGPSVPHDIDCDDRDFDEDGDIDQEDFAVFQRCISGENVPAAPTCAD